MHSVFILRWYKYVLDFPVALEVCVDAILAAYVFNSFTETLYIWYDYEALVCVAVFGCHFCFFLILLVLLKISAFILSVAHYGYLQFMRTSIMCYFLCSKWFWCGWYCLALYVKMLMTLYLAPYVVMTVPMQVLVCIGGFFTCTCDKCLILFWCDQCVQEWDRTICPCVFCCLFGGTIYVVDTLKEAFFVFCVLYHKCVIYKPLP